MKGFLRGVRGVVRSPCHKQVKIIGKNTEATVFCFLKLFLRGFLPGLGLFCLSRRVPVLIGKPEVLCQLYGGFFLSQPIQGRRQNQSHPHPHRSRSSGNADPASCLGFYRYGTGSEPFVLAKLMKTSFLFATVSASSSDFSIAFCLSASPYSNLS